jgi:hypothetical protein
MIDAPELRARRIAAWSKELLDPKTAGVAAMKLEGLGTTAVESLQAGVKNTNPQVRFFSAEALAYLNDVAGVEALGDTVIHQPDFRTYALAALAALDQSASHIKLRKLMDEPDIQVRYGAFNALRTLDPRDPYLGHVRVIDEPKHDDEDEEPADSMAVAIASASRRRRRQDDPFALYVVDSEGPPLVHVSRTRRSEIVVFGRQQKLLPPIVLGTGAILLNAAVNDEKIEVSKIVPSQFGDADVKITATLDLADVIRRTANLGASYPEIVAILETANRQKNLAGILVVDAVPSTSRLYLEAVLGKDTTAKKDDSLKRASGATSKPKRFSLFGFLSRDPDAPVKNKSASRGAGKDPASMLGENKTSPTDPGILPNATSLSNPDASGSAKKGDGTAGGTTAKKDDAVQKATDQDPAPRRGAFDFSRGSDQ